MSEPKQDQIAGPNEPAQQTPHSIFGAEALKPERVRVPTRGHAPDVEQFVEGVTTKAVGICGLSQRFVATLACRALLLRVDLARAMTFLPDMRAAAVELSQLFNQQAKRHDS